MKKTQWNKGEVAKNKVGKVGRIMSLKEYTTLKPYKDFDIVSQCERSYWVIFNKKKIEFLTWLVIGEATSQNRKSAMLLVQ